MITMIGDHYNAYLDEELGRELENDDFFFCDRNGKKKGRKRKRQISDNRVI